MKIHGEIEVGQYVRLWCDASYYGKVSKLNKKTFAVTCGNTNRRLYKYDSPMAHNGNYVCTRNIFKCSVITDDPQIESAKRHLGEC